MNKKKRNATDELTRVNDAVGLLTVASLAQGLAEMDCLAVTLHMAIMGPLRRHMQTLIIVRDCTNPAFDKT
eukprot:3591310-Amphidinium_carterae.1